MSEQYTQKNNSICIVTPLKDDELLLDRFSGVEGLSEPYIFEIDLLSLKPDISADDILRKPMSLWFKLDDGKRIEKEVDENDDEGGKSEDEGKFEYEGGRWINGIVRRFVRTGRAQGLSQYRVELVPWLWFQTLAADCRVFQSETVVDIVTRILKNTGMELRSDLLTEKYEPREYCIQYNESNFNFISRLMEEEGIYYYFEHTKDAHTMVLSDNSSGVKKISEEAVVRVLVNPVPGEDTITGLNRDYSAHSGKVTFSQFNPMNPRSGVCETICSQLEDEGEELYNNLGEIRCHDSVEDPNIDVIERYDRLELERQEVRRYVLSGSSACEIFAVGTYFELEVEGEAESNKEYKFIQLTHSANMGSYVAGRRRWRPRRNRSSEQDDYSNSFMAIPRDVVFRPQIKARKPIMNGSHTATVVGESGDEICVDENGRIKIQFHWDRRALNAAKCSCWVRVSTPWGGKGYGAIHIPRVEQEVVVSFLDGDPDKPLVTGCVYNAGRMPPWSLPVEKTRGGIKTRSSKGGGGYNEISLDDLSGEEQIRIHAQKDMKTDVLNFQSTTVGNNQTVQVGNDQEVTVDNNQNVKVNNAQKVWVTNNQDIDVEKGDRKIEVKAGKITEKARKQISLTSSDEHIEISAKEHIHLTSTKGDVVAKGEVGSVHLVGESEALVSGKQGAKVISVSGPVSIEGSTSIELSAGGSYIKLSSSGIEIKGVGSGVEITGSQVKINS